MAFTSNTKRSDDHDRDRFSPSQSDSNDGACSLPGCEIDRVRGPSIFRVSITVRNYRVVTGRRNQTSTPSRCKWSMFGPRGHSVALVAAYVTDEMMMNWTVHRIDDGEGRLWLSLLGSAVDTLLIFSERAIEDRWITDLGIFLSMFYVLSWEPFLYSAAS